MAGTKRPGKTRKWLERVALGAIMSVVAFVVERRLLKVIRKRGDEKPDPRDASVS